jgi:hypothetical protein
MQKELLSEIRQLKAVISTLIGTSDLPAKERFSKEALARAAKEFKKLSIERGEWCNCLLMLSSDKSVICF